MTAGVCIIHLIRNTFRLASKKDWDALKRDVKPIYTAPNPNAARAALEDLDEKWGKKYGAIIRLWESAWEEFIPFLDYDIEIRTVICSTNAIWVFDLTCRGCLASRPDRLPLALNAIDDYVLDSKCRVSRPKVSGPGCLA